MSVIIKDMDMPVDCLGCRIACDKENYLVIGRPPKCPLEEVQDEPRGVYQCFHCGSYSVVWGADFDFSDYGLEGEGIVHSCHCGNCGADIEYYVRIDDD